MCLGTKRPYTAFTNDALIDSWNQCPVPYFL